MSCSWNNDELFVATAQPRQSFAVHSDYRLVIASHDRKRSSVYGAESVLTRPFCDWASHLSRVLQQLHESEILMQLHMAVKKR